MKQQLKKDIGGDLLLQVVENNIQIIPTAPKITIYDQDGGEKVAQVSASVDASGDMTYNISASLCDDLYTNWKAEWEYTHNAETHYRTQLFDIVRYLLPNVVIDQDIINRASFIEELNYRHVGTNSNTGSKVDIIDTELNQDDNYWTGGIVEITAGINEGQTRKVTNFVKATNTLTVSPGFISDLDATSEYIVIRTFKKEIDEAFNIFKQDLINRGLKPHNIIEPTQTKEYIIVKALELICNNFSKDVVDIWNTRSQDYRQSYGTLIKTAIFDYDSDESGTVDSDEESKNLTQGRATR